MSAGQHRLRALVQAPQQRTEGGADDEGNEHGAHPRSLACRLEGAFGGGVEAFRLARLLHVALYHGNGVEHLGGDGAGVGHAVLAGAAELAHAAAEPDAGQHHQNQRAQHLRHHVGVGDDQHGHRADAHHRVAQAHAQAGADDRLYQRRVGGQARQHLAGLRGLEELGALLEHVGVDSVAQVGGDTLAEPSDHVEAPGREHAQRDADAEQREEVAAQRHDALARIGGDQALVDQRLQRDRQCQRGQRGEHQEQPGQRDAAAVGAQERRQAGERAHLLRGGGRLRRGDGCGGDRLGGRHAASLGDPHRPHRLLASSRLMKASLKLCVSASPRRSR
jgi:hypothetical protein